MPVQPFNPQTFLGSGMLSDDKISGDEGEDRSQIDAGLKRILESFEAIDNASFGQNDGAVQSDGSEGLPPTPTDKATTAASTATGSEVDATNVANSGAEGLPSEPSNESSSEQTEPEVFHVKLSNGYELDITPQQIESLIALDQWAANLDPNLRHAYAEIAAGNAVAIPLDFAREFVEWKRNGGVQQQAPQTPPANNLADKLQFVDPEVAEILHQQQAEIAALKATVPNQQTVSVPMYRHDPTVAAQQQLHQQRSAIAIQTLESFAAANGLSEPEIAEVANKIVSLQMIPEIYRQNTVYAPNGQPLQEPTFDQVMATAVQYATTLLPHINQKIAANSQQRQQSQSQPNPQLNPQIQAQTPISSNPVQNNVVPLKKARSSSLAAAPSTNASTPQKAVSALSPDELTAEIAAFIRQETGG
jgi:hypothetical protein